MTETLSAPANVAQAVVGVHGQAGREWLGRLPTLLESLGRRWQLQYGPPFQRLASSYVMPVVLKDGTPGVLKATVPGRALDLEVAALRSFAGRGLVRLLDADIAVGAILLERLEPGTPLSELRDEDHGAGWEPWIQCAELLYEEGASS